LLAASGLCMANIMPSQKEIKATLKNSNIKDFNTAFLMSCSSKSVC
jgi:hypothetical protein